MSTLAAFFADITFLEVGMSLITVGILERIMCRMSNDIVGPGGWLLDTGAHQ